MSRVIVDIEKLTDGLEEGIGETRTVFAPAHPVMVDASVSQFLDYAGLSTEYERITGETIYYPPEKVFVFELAERMVLVEWLATSVRTFQEINKRPIGAYTLQYGVGPLADASYPELVDTYSAIWEPANISPWQPPREVIRDGLIVSQSIPSGAIEVID